MVYTIQNEHIVCEINSRGAELYSLKSKNGIEYIWQRDPEYWSYCAPVLFPIVGRLKDNRTIINEKDYFLNSHGFLRDQEFEVFQIKDSEISLVNTFNQNTLKLYPFKYKVMITYTLTDKTLRTNYKVINETEGNIVFNIGGHPAFNCPLYPGEEFEDYTIYFEEAESFTSPKVEANGTLNFDEPVRRYEGLEKLELDYNLFTIDTIVIPRVRSHYVSLLNKEGKGLKLSFPDFKSFGIWTPYKKKPKFICLEPWHGYGDRHNSDNQFSKKDDLIKVKPLEDFNIHYDIEIIE